MPPFQPPFRRRPSATPVSGGQPLALPLVATVAVNNVTATGGNLIGSIDPQGLAGSCWFVYGTTPQFGSVTATQVVAATTIPQTVTATISGLATNTLYWFALVGQTAAGTVTSSPLTFTPSITVPVLNPGNLPTPTATPQVTVPHYRFPISFSAAAGIGVVQQDTLDEVFSNVQAIAVCPVGACPELPEFGLPDPTFGLAPLDPSAVIAAVKQWEPRADETAVSQALGDPNAGAWQIMLTTGLAGSD